MGFISNLLYRLGIVSGGVVQDAAKKGDRERLAEVLRRKPDLLKSRNSAGWTAFGVAVFAGQKDTAHILIVMGANVDEKGGYGCTPLHLVASTGNEDMTRFLIEQGADINAKDDYGATPLHCTFLPQAYMPGPRMKRFVEGRRGVARALLDKGAEVNVFDNNGWTPLHIAVQIDEADSVQQLLDYGADSNAKHRTLGSTPLHFALVKEKAQTQSIVEMLVACGADVNAITNSGARPLAMAQTFSPNIAEILRKKGAKVSLPDP